MEVKGCPHSIWHAKKKCEENYKMKPLKELWNPKKKVWKTHNNDETIGKEVTKHKCAEEGGTHY